MARRKDPTDVDQTCPLIDEVLRFIEAVSMDNQDNEDYQKDCDRAEQVLEMIRTANSKLRDFGCKEYEKEIDLEKDLERANDRINELEKESKWYEKSIDQLKDTIYDLEIQLTEQQDQ